MGTNQLNESSEINEIPLFRHCFTILIFFSVFYTLWFLPSLLAGQLLGPGDGYIQSLPAYYAPRTLWTTQLLGGFPVAADVTPQTWYPLSLFLSRFPHSWNAFVISSYVLASAFTYAYVRLITRSTLAGLVSGLTYGCSGFMMAHLGHVSMIHTATWIPLTLFSCEQLLRSRRKKWLLLLSFSVACLFLAGHPQISVYGLGLLIIYGCFFGALDSTRWQFYRLFSIAILTGIGLATIQLIPTSELASMTPRAEMSFQDFLAFSMPLSHAVMVIFPYIFGGGTVYPYNLFPYIGVSSPTEIPIYMGLLPLTLALVGGKSDKYPRTFRYFWIIVAILSFLLMLGATTPVAWISYQIPGYNKFRIPSRHGIELAMAISVLAGLGIKAVQQGEWSREHQKKMLRFSICCMGIFTLWAVIACLYFLNKKNLAQPVFYIPFLGAAIGPPLTLFLVGWASLILYDRKRSTATIVSLLIVLTLDLSAFGWFYGQNSPHATEIFPIPLFLQKYQSSLNQYKQRFFPLQGGLGKISEVPANLSRLWNAPNMNGYGPFLISRVGEFMSSATSGVLTSSSPLWDSKNLSFDLTAVRYITTTAKSEIPALIPDNGVKWSQENLPISLGSACLDTPVQSVDINLPEPLLIDSISFVGALGCSPSTVQGSNVLEMEVIDREGKVMSHMLKAGQDLSEVSIECPQVASQMKHQIATVFQKTPIVGQNCPANSYVSSISLQKPSEIRQLKLRNPKDNNSVVHLNKISFNNSITGASYPFIGSRWKYVEDLGDVRVYENLNVMPRAWLVSQVQTVQPSQILNAVKTSQLPNGEVFNPRTTALIEEPINFSSSPPDPKATVQVEFPTETQVRVTTHSTQPSFLVLSDVFYPGWEAHIDEKPAHIFQTDHILRGLNLPSGDHTISFSFRPKSFAIGCGISGASLALLLYLVITDRQNGQTASTPISPIHHESV